MSDVLNDAQAVFKRISNTNFTSKESIGGYYCQFTDSVMAFKEDSEKVKKALDLLEEKEKGVKPKPNDSKEYEDEYDCGNCGTWVGNIASILNESHCYCIKCGTKIDRSVMDG